MELALLTDGITPFVMGGMQRHSANLVKYLTLNGIRVTLVHCVPFGERLPDSDEVNASLFGEGSPTSLKEVICLHFPQPGKVPGHYIRNSYKYSKIVYQSIADKSFDFIYAKGFAGWETIRQKKAGTLDTPIGVKFHGYEMFQPAPTLKQKVESRMLKKPTRWNNQHADYVFSYGGQISEIIKKMGISDHRILEYTSGIDNIKVRDEYTPTEPDKTRFVYLGRVERRKGIHEIFEALEKLTQTDASFEFHFIGPVEPNSSLEDSRITYHGSFSDMDKILALLDQMDVLVCPSHSEGMPNVIIESMSRGLAILTTRVGAIEEIVNHENGEFVTPADSNELAETLQSFCSMSREEIDQKKVASLNKVKNDLTWDQIAKRMIQDLKGITLSVS